jgi:hypothetical protein
MLVHAQEVSKEPICGAGEQIKTLAAGTSQK